MKFLTTLKSDYKSLIFVCAAFFLMAFVSYGHVGVLMKKQIDLLSRSEIQAYQSALRFLIMAHEDALRHAAALLVVSLEHGDGPERRQTVLHGLNGDLRAQPDTKDFFLSFYGYIDGAYVNGDSLVRADWANRSETASWLKGALNERGVFHSKPARAPGTGRMVGSMSVAVIDNKGLRRGVLALDYQLDQLIVQVSDYKLSGLGFGLLLDDSFNALSFPGKEFIGRNIETVPGFAGLSRKLVRAGDGTLTELVEHDGKRDIGFFVRLENGWYLGLIAPLKYYYGDVSDLRPTLFALAFGLSLCLSAVLIRLSADKTRSEEKNRFKSSFLARMSHEIRTPLNAILGMTALAQRRYGEPEGRKYIEEIKRAGDHLMGLINGILDLSKVESGRMQLARAPYRTADILEDALSMTRAQITSSGKTLALESEIAPDLPRELIGDEDRVLEILLNLLSNAVKYTPAGTVRFRAESRPAGAGLARLTFAVEDSGPGLKPEQSAVLFNEFVRLESQDRPIEGSGLGLSIARSLCRAMGGDISVTSRYGEGSTFTAEIEQLVSDPAPAEALRPAGETDDEPEPPFIAPDFKILIVDDIPANLIVAEGLLAPFKARIDVCLSGQEAIEAVKKEDYNLIFVDHMMPGLDGLETLKALRKVERLNGTPIVALTANAMSGMAEMFLAIGFNDYLAKPIEMRKLSALMERWVPESARAKPL